MNEQTLFKSWTLAPLAQVEVNAEGRFMYVEQCDGDVSISLDDGATFKIRSGFEFLNRDFRKFRLISNVGTGGANVNVRIYAGHVYVSNRNPVVYTRPAPNYLVCSSQVVGAAEYSIPNTNTRTGQATADKQVRVRIENQSSVNNLEIRIGGVTVAILTNNTGTKYFETIETPDQINLYSSVGATAGLMRFYELPT